MKESLKNLLRNSYAPYSKFHVAAIVKMKDGKYYAGVNVENANYTSICAERNAIASAIASGYKRFDFEAIYNLGIQSPYIFLNLALFQAVN